MTGRSSAPGSDSDPDLGSGELGTDSDDAFLREAARVERVAPPCEEPDRAGQRLGQFAIEHEIGRGGMGIVYAAVDEALGRRVALKVLPASLATDPERRARLLREARAASAISHPNIAAVFTAGETDGSVFIAMEHVEGRTVRQLLDRGPLSTPEAVRIAREVGRALEKAHGAGIVHRDLKPDNVMVGDDGSVKILDFGLAKPIGSRGPAIESAAVLSTVEGRILGTPSYMSPEQAKGREVDGRSDLFSLGVMLYEMLSARRPFNGRGPTEILIAIDRDAPAPLDEVDRALARTVMRCLAKAPAERFASAAELLLALDAPPRPPRQRKVALALAAAIVVALTATFWPRSRALPAAGVAGLAGAPVVAEPPRPPPVEPTAPAPSQPVAVATVSVARPPVRSRPTPREPPRAPPAVKSATPVSKRDPLAEQK